MNKSFWHTRLTWGDVCGILFIWVVACWLVGCSHKDSCEKESRRYLDISRNSGEWGRHAGTELYFEHYFKCIGVVSEEQDENYFQEEMKEHKH